MKIRAVLIAVLVAAFATSQVPTLAQETKDFSQDFLSGKTTVTTRKLANGHMVTTEITKATGTNPQTAEYKTLNRTVIRETDGDGKPVSRITGSVIETFKKKGGELTERYTQDEKSTYNEGGGHKTVLDTTVTTVLVNETSRMHAEGEYDASNRLISGHRKITSNVPGEKPREERWNKDSGGWEIISRAGGHGAPGKKTITGPHFAKRSPVTSGTRGRKSAAMYLYGKITSLKGCHGEFYKAFPKVGSGSLDGGKVTTKGGVFELNGSVAEYDPYRGTLMADGTFHLTSSRDAGTTIVGTIHQDNTVSGTWHQVYDPSCAYDVTLERGKTMSGSHISVDGGGSWRLALSGLHQ